jgi:hypothetical protein
MSNRLAALIGFLVLAAIIGDAMFYDNAGTLFLARKLADLVAWVAFWR